MNDKLRILHLEDNPRDAELIQAALTGGGVRGDLVLVADETGFRSAVSGGRFDLILSDYALNGYDGMSALELVRRTDADVPFIFVSGTLGEEAAIDSLKTGATDYILKNRLSKLVPAVRRALDEVEQRNGRRRADEKLKLLETAVQQVSESIAITNAELDGPGPRFQFVNFGFTTMTGYTAEEVLGHTPEILHGPKTDRTLLEQLRFHLARGEAFRSETIAYRKDASEFYLQSSVVPLRDTQGQITHFVAVQQDVTERKHNEARLLRAQRLESIGALASGIAHDLNNILAPILMSAPMLRWNLPPHEAEQILSSIETSAQRGAELVKQLLLFGRGVEAKRTTMDLRQLIRELLQMIRETFPEAIQVETAVAPDLWPVDGDATQLNQVLLNLCVNARDAMPSGGRLTLSAENLPPDSAGSSQPAETRSGAFVRLRVQDTGTGIPPGVLGRIFDPFFTTKEQGSGTGLGLSIALGIVKKHCGLLDVQSEPGVGTTFSVYLPAAAATSVSGNEPGPRMPPAQGHGELVLVVDDEPEILRLTDQYLTRNGYRTLLARDGVDAIAQFTERQNEIHAMVADLDMPQMDGVALTQTIWRMNPSLPVIISSGIGHDRGWLEKLGELTASGSYAMLVKPYSAEKLLETLKEVPRKPVPSHRTYVR